MSYDIWIAYVVTVLALMSTPGPSQLLMLATSAEVGFGKSLMTALGDLTANMFQMLAAGLGLAAILAAAPHWLTLIKWAGVSYLIWQGVLMFRRAATSANSKDMSTRNATPVSLWLRGFATSATNPKAVVFFAALFPQFIQAEGSFWWQFSCLSVTYLALDGLFLSAYGFGAQQLARRLANPMWMNQIGGGFMLLAALLLSFKAMTEI